MSEITQKRPVCACCGSENAGVDATAVWNIDLGEYELSSAHDTTWCDDCGVDDPGLSWEEIA